MIDGVAASLAVLGAIIWGVRQEGRINSLNQRTDANDKVNEERLDGLKELIEARFDGTDTKFDGIVWRLERMERGINGDRDRDSRDRMKKDYGN